MNFLAHLYLSCGSEDLLVGNFIADFINNKQKLSYSESIQEGIMLHRSIDSFTDNHPMVKLSKNRLYPSQGKYAPVAVDILFDHLLAINWKRYSGITLEDFAVQIYEVFARRMEEFPPRLKKILPYMINDHFLESYAHIPGLKFTLEKMDQRSRFKSNFVGTINVLEKNSKAFNHEFNAFFPELIEFVETTCAC